MANQIVPAPSTLPGIVDDEIGGIIDGFTASINAERGFDAMPRLPSKMERVALETRRSILARRLAPIVLSMAQRDDLMQMLGQLWLRYPSLRNADVGSMSTAYMIDLEQYPMFAVKAALDDVHHGRIKSLDPDWPPTSVRIVEQVKRHAEPVAAAMARLQRVLKIDKVCLPDNSAVGQRIAADVHAFVAERRAAQREDDQRIREDACKHMGKTAERMQREEYAALGVEPIESGGMVISPSLAKKLGVRLKRGPHE